MFSRRDWIKGLLALPAVVGFARSGRAQTTSATKVPQKVAQYQDKPKDGHHCDLCKYFIAGSSPTANGSCQLVEGSINPNGWCMLFAPKA
jgi:hypothetical protein